MTLHVPTTITQVIVTFSKMLSVKHYFDENTFITTLVVKAPRVQKPCGILVGSFSYSSH